MADDIIALQARIKAEAQEQHAAMEGLASWMGTIGQKDARLRQVAQQQTKQPQQPAVAAPRGSPLADALRESPQCSAAGSAAAHTYDKGYAKWAAFDADQAAAEVDAPRVAAGLVTAPLPLPLNDDAASAAGPRVPSKKVVHVRAGNSGLAASEEEAARAAGNAAYGKRDFEGAVAAYSRAIVANPHSSVAYSNRAMAHLQLRGHRQALDDATSALRLDETHVKSWLRRAAARGALGMHAAAARDLEVAQALEPANREAAAELRKSREAARACRKRAAAERAIPLPVLAAAVDDDASVCDADYSTRLLSLAAASGALCYRVFQDSAPPPQLDLLPPPTPATVEAGIVAGHAAAAPPVVLSETAASPAPAAAAVEALPKLSGAGLSQPALPSIPALLQTPAASAIDFERAWRSLASSAGRPQQAQALRAYFLLYTMLVPPRTPPARSAALLPAVAAGAAGENGALSLQYLTASRLMQCVVLPAAAAAARAAGSSAGVSPLRSLCAALLSHSAPPPPPPRGGGGGGCVLPPDTPQWPAAAAPAFRKFVDADLLVQIVGTLAAALAAAAAGDGDAGDLWTRLPFFPAAPAAAAAVGEEAADRTEPALSSGEWGSLLRQEVALRALLVLHGLSPVPAVTRTLLGAAERTAVAALAGAVAAALHPALVQPMLEALRGKAPVGELAPLASQNDLASALATSLVG